MTQQTKNLEPELIKTPSGDYSLRLGEHWLEDPTDPIKAAIQFADHNVVKDFDWIVLFGAGLGYRVARLKALGVKHVCVIDPIPSFLKTVAEGFSAHFEGALLCNSCEELLQELSMRIERTDKIALLSTQTYKKLFPEEEKRATAAVKEAISYANLRWNSLKSRAAPAIESVIQNLSVLHKTRMGSSLIRPLEGIPAFIVAAGPSLDKNVHLLPEAAKRGAIFAVNTSAPMVVAQNTLIDVLVSIESLPVRDVLDVVKDQTRLLALQINAHPNSLGAPGFEKIVFCASRAFPQIAAALDMPRLQYNGNVAMAAFALACQWGANPVILLGQDCAFTGGRMYASGSDRESWRVIVDGEYLSYECDQSYIDFFVKNNIPPPQRTPRTRVPGWNGAIVDSVPALCETRRWFERAVLLNRDRILVNATEGGARIEGFQEFRLEEVLEMLPPLSILLHSMIQSTPRYDIAILQQLVADLEKALRKVEQAAKEALRTGLNFTKAADKLRRISADIPIMNYYCAKELLEIRENKNLGNKKRARLTFDAIYGSSRKLIELLENTSESLINSQQSQQPAIRKVSNG